MSPEMRFALAVGPLGLYFWVLAVWHGGRHPRVIPGLVDFALLAFGLGGVLAFGPFGDFLARLFFGKPDTLDRMVVVSGLGLVACVLARKSLHRVVVYHVEPEALRKALDSALSPACGRFVPTLTGFEDRPRGKGLKVDVTARTGCAVVEAFGNDPERLIQEIRPPLRRALGVVPASGPSLSPAFYGASVLVVLAPVLTGLLNKPRTMEALWALLRRLRGV